MRYSILTPTLLRPSLKQLCTSIDNQTETDWEHIIIVDLPLAQFEAKKDFIVSLAHPNRLFLCCEVHHNNGGNTCRNKIDSFAHGEYLFYIDDDDYFSDTEVLATLNCVTSPWAVFPANHYGQYFLQLPPGMCRTGTGMFMYKRGIAKWPDVTIYESDGILIEELMQKFPYEVVNGRALVIQPKQNKGEMF